MEKTFWWVWKFMLQALGGSIFLLPYVAGQVGLIAFSVILIGEALITGNSMLIFRDMAHKEDRKEAPESKGSEDDHSNDDDEEREGHSNIKDDPRHNKNDDIGRYMMRNNYFTIVSDSLDSGDSNFWYWVICLVFLLEVVICTSFYFKLFIDIFIEVSGIACLNPSERPGYYLLVHVMVALLLVGVEDVTEKMERQQATIYEVRTTLKECNVETLKITPISHKPPAVNHRRRNMIDMRAVAERLHGYSWKRCCLFFLFLFFVVSTLELKAEISHVVDVESSNFSSTLCPGLLERTYYIESPSNLIQNPVMCMSIILLSLMHFAIFLPICLEELKLPEKEYIRSVRRSSMAFTVIFLFIATVGNSILGHSTPILFPTAFGSSIYGFNISLIAMVFTVVAMLLRVMACCRLIQVLFRSESDSAYWIIVSLLFVISYWISKGTPSVLYLGIMLGGGTSNLLLIIFPRMAYWKYLKKEKNETCYQTLTCAVGHVMLLLVWVIYGCYNYMWNIGEMVIDTHIGENCKYVFDEIWKSHQRCSIE